MIRARPHVAAMDAYALPDVSAPAGKRLISLALNESALPPSPNAIAAGSKALASGQLYAAEGWSDLRDAIAEVHDLNREDILCSGGSMALIETTMRCFAGPGDRVLASQYSYAFLRVAALAAGAEYAAAPEVDFTVSIDALLAAVQPATRIVCLVNPGNPTGTRIPYSEIVRLRDSLDDDVLLLIDEAYGEFTDQPAERTFELTERGNTVVLRTFSKVYALAGMRVGWGIYPAALRREMLKLLGGNTVSVAAEAAAAAAMRDQAYMRGVCNETSRRRQRFVAQLRDLGFDVPESHTNFALIRFASAEAAGRADRMLRAEGYVLRGMGLYALPDCLRATIGDAKDMDAVAGLLGDWLKEGNNT
ncbi:MAG: aminotransferase class I/II-fold pyridoxal phosphate-dependent enzyme [Rhizobiales bacterium]|nr:aminotransferase class I/II-fold pyridoxal phosphate-dependent enzyme [Hyphomicrobiales bacterium]